MHLQPRSLMITSLFILLIFIFISTAKAETQWTSCGKGSFQLENAVLSPDVITPGTRARFTINAKSGNQPITAGNVLMLVKLAGLPIYTQQDDLCSKTTCPISPNTDTKIVYEQDFPEYTPAAEYSVLLSGKSVDGTDLFCVEITFSVTPQSSQSLLKDIMISWVGRSRGLWKRKYSKLLL